MTRKATDKTSVRGLCSVRRPCLVRGVVLLCCSSLLFFFVVLLCCSSLLFFFVVLLCCYYLTYSINSVADLVLFRAVPCNSVANNPALPCLSVAPEINVHS